MVNTIECGKLERQILGYLALHPDSLIKPIEEALDSYYKNVHDDVQNLCAKGYVEFGRQVKTKKGATQQGYRLSSDGLLYVFSHERITVDTDKSTDGIDIKKVLDLYDEGNEFLKEYKRIYAQFPNKSLVIGLLRTAASFALKHENVDAIMDDPKHLLKASAEIEDFYGQRPDDERACLHSFADSIDRQIKSDPELNRIYQKRKRMMRRLAKKAFK